VTLLSSADSFDGPQYEIVGEPLVYQIYFNTARWRILGTNSAIVPHLLWPYAVPPPPAKTRQRNDRSGYWDTLSIFIQTCMVETSIQLRFLSVLTFEFMIL
jgi:hypothetical protein